MPFQQTVPFNVAAGLPGELAADGPLRSETMRLIENADFPLAEIEFGRAFSYADPADYSNPLGGTNVSVAQPGQSLSGGMFAGILIHPKAHANYGSAAGALTPMYTLPENSWGELCRVGILFVKLTAATAEDGVPGALIGFNETGEIVAFASAPPSKVATIPGARLLTNIGAAVTPGLAKIELTTVGLAPPVTP